VGGAPVPAATPAAEARAEAASSGPAAAPAAVPGTTPPAGGWIAAFKHLFELTGADHEGPEAGALCVAAGYPFHTPTVPADVLAAIQTRAPIHDSADCRRNEALVAAPDGGLARLFTVDAALREPGLWGVDLTYYAGPLNGTTWNCKLVQRTPGLWTVYDCRRTFTS
jgi:hypothetical protein